MMTAEVNAHVGQCWHYASDNAPAAVYSVTKVDPPTSFRSARRIELSPARGGRSQIHSWTEFAHLIASGRLVAEGWQNGDTHRMDAIPLSGLLERMNDAQRARFSMRLSYVMAVQDAGCGFSHKSRAFRDLVAAVYQARSTEHKARLMRAAAGTPVPFLEKSSPAPTAVYRWCLRYRKSGSNPLVLAQEVLAIHRRRPRKMRERELLVAFLSAKRSRVERTTGVELTRQFNKLLARLSPLKYDDEIAKMYEEAERTAKRNALMRKSRGVNKKGRSRASSARPGPST